MRTPRSIRNLSRCHPSLAAHDTAYLGWRNSKFGRKTSSASSPFGQNARAYFSNILLCQFPGSAFLSILHSAMQAHIHLVVAMRRPSQIINMIIGWIAVFVCYVWQQMWIWQECESDQPMGRSSVWSVIAWLPKNESNVTMFGCGSGNLNRLIASRGMRVPPSALLSSPAA